MNLYKPNTYLLSLGVSSCLHETIEHYEATKFLANLSFMQLVLFMNQPPFTRQILKF
jgi:hypothetical protein